MLISRAVLILLSLSVCTVRIHRQHVDVSGALRAMNSCLRVMRHASRRRSSMPFEEYGTTTTSMM
jgi:hypothetical protein